MDVGPAPWVRWLAVPAVLVMLALAALAIASEERQEFVARTEAEQQMAAEAEAAESQSGQGEPGQGQSGEGQSGQGQPGQGQSGEGEPGQGQSGQGQSGQGEPGESGQGEPGQGGQGGGGAGGSGQGAQPGEAYPADRLIIQTENGPVELSLNGNDVQGRSGGTGGTGSGNALALRPDPNGNIIGFRIDEDGNFVPVERGESTEGLTLLVPQEDGSILLVRPDGSEIELYYTDNGLEAKVDGGEGYALEAEDGSVRVDDLVMTPLPQGQPGNFEDFQQLPPDGLPQLEDGEPGTGNQITPEDLDPDTNTNDDDPEDDNADDTALDEGGSWPLRNILIIALLAVGVGLAIWWFYAMRPRRDEEDFVPAPVHAAAPDGLSAWEAFEAFLAELAADPDPTRAIRLAFAYTEQGMGHLPGRATDETPQEWLARTAAVANDSVAGALRPLVDRYSDIRFGRHIASSEERDDALMELRALVDVSMRQPGSSEPLAAEGALGTV